MSSTRGLSGPATPAMLRAAVEARDFDCALQCAWTLYHPGLRTAVEEIGIPLDHVDDVLQDGFARAFTAWPQFKGDRFVSWLFTMVRYEARSVRRRYSRRVILFGSVKASKDVDSFTPEDEADAREVVAAVERLVSELDPVSSAIFDALVDPGLQAGLAARASEVLGYVVSEDAIQARRYRLRLALTRAISGRTNG